MARNAAKVRSGTKQPRKPRHKTIPQSYHHRPPVSGELSNYLRWRRRYEKRTAEQNGTMERVRISEPATLPNPVQVPPWRPIKNPNATFLGLPTEIRLQIYAYLSDITLIHVHSPRTHTYTWTPCKASNPVYPHLCLNPKWSGLCSEYDRCTFKQAAPPEPRGFWALRASSQLLRYETQDFVMKNGAFSIHPVDISGWLKFLKTRARKQMSSIRSITLAGPDHYILSPGYGVDALQDEILNFPYLSAVGVQCQTPRYWWLADGKEEIDVEQRWEYWNAVLAVQHLSPQITVVVEGTIWLRKRKQQQAITRVVRIGKEIDFEGEGWENEDVKLEIVQPRGLVEKGKDAGWRIWWMREELKYFG